MKKLLLVAVVILLSSVIGATLEIGMGIIFPSFISAIIFRFFYLVSGAAIASVLDAK